MRDMIRTRPLPDAPLGMVERVWYGGLVGQLVARRRQLGLSQSALDEKLGFSPGQVGKYEVLDRAPNPFLLMCWCQALGVELRVRSTEPAVAVPEGDDAHPGWA